MKFLGEAMKKEFAYVLRNEQGSLLLVFAMVGAVLMGLMGLTVDVGLAYTTKAKLNAAVDAAVLAGAQELPGNPVRAREIAVTYAVANGVRAELVSTEVSGDNHRLTVRAEDDIRFFFGSFFNRKEEKILVSAQAQVGSITGVVGAAPLAVEDHPLQFGVKYKLKHGSGGEGSSLGSGNYGALALGKSGASTYEQNLTYGYQGMLRVGETIPTEPGNMSNPTKRGLDARLDNCPEPNCSFHSFSRSCTHIIYVPIYQPLVDKNFVILVGFGAFYVEKVVGQGQNSEIHGYFVKTVASGIAEPFQHDYGLKAVSLVH
ncbi:MAG: TadE/TadG family type IV pilus assembly protein [Bacillota bacterium]